MKFYNFSTKVHNQLEYKTHFIKKIPLNVYIGIQIRKKSLRIHNTAF